MAKGRSKEELAEIGAKTKFNGRSAAEANKKSREKHMQNKAEKLIIRDELIKRLNAKDLNEIIDNLIDRAKADSRDFVVLQEAMGQKPANVVDLGEETRNTINDASQLTMADKFALIREAANTMREMDIKNGKV